MTRYMHNFVIEWKKIWKNERNIWANVFLTINYRDGWFEKYEIKVGKSWITDHLGLERFEFRIFKKNSNFWLAPETNTYSIYVFCFVIITLYIRSITIFIANRDHNHIQSVCINIVVCVCANLCATSSYDMLTFETRIYPCYLDEVRTFSHRFNLFRNIIK